MMLRPSEDEENLIKWFYWILRTDNFNPILSMQTDNSAFDSWWVVLFGSSFLTLELKGQQQIWQMHNQGNHNFFLLFPYIFSFSTLDYTEILMTMDLEASRPNQDMTYLLGLLQEILSCHGLFRESGFADRHFNGCYYSACHSHSAKSELNIGITHSNTNTHIYLYTMCITHTHTHGLR